MNMQYKYNHLGIPTEEIMPGMLHLKHLKVYATDHQSNPFGIQWMKYEAGCGLPDLVCRQPHVAFEVDDLQAVLAGKKVIIQPNSPSPGVMVAFIEEAGAPIEFLQFEKKP